MTPRLLLSWHSGKRTFHVAGILAGFALPAPAVPAQDVDVISAFAATIRETPLTDAYAVFAHFGLTKLQARLHPTNVHVFAVETYKQSAWQLESLELSPYVADKADPLALAR